MEEFCKLGKELRARFCDFEKNIDDFEVWSALLHAPEFRSRNGAASEESTT